MSEILSNTMPENKYVDNYELLFNKLADFIQHDKHIKLPAKRQRKQSSAFAGLYFRNGAWLR